MSTTTPDVDYEAIKKRQQVNWSAGDYAVIGTTLQIMGEQLCESVDVSAGWRVADLAAGNGNASLAAARRGCEVTAVDYVPSLLERLRARAGAEGLAIEAVEGDAEATGLPDAAFDAVLSTVGIMFTPNQPRAAAELVRLCRPGGRIGLASWTPASFVGQMFKAIGGYVPPPPGVRSPMEWGTEDRVRELLGGAVNEVRAVERRFTFRYRSAQDLLAAFRSFYGPMAKTFEALEDDRRDGLARDLVALADSRNVADDGTLKIPSEYLEVVAVRA